MRLRKCQLNRAPGGVLIRTCRSEAVVLVRLSSLKARHVNRSLRRSDGVEPSHLYALLGA